MSLLRRWGWIGILVGMGGALSPARATLPVIDVATIAQLVEQMQVLQQQLATLNGQLTQAQAQYAAVTGSRGMEQLLAGTARNYLPADWAQLQSALQQSAGQYRSLSNTVQAVIRSHIGLSGELEAQLGPMARARLLEERRQVATAPAIAESALTVTSERFRALGELIAAIPRATDEKAVLDLQARIGSEQAMLQNEQTKLTLMLTAAQAEGESHRWQNEERALEDYGSLRALPAMGL